MTWKIMRIIHIYKSGCIKLKASIKSFFSNFDWRGIWCKDVSQNFPMYFTGVSKCTNTNSSQLRKKNTIHTHKISEYWHKSQTLWIRFQSLTSLPCTLQNKWLWLMLETDRQTDRQEKYIFHQSWWRFWVYTKTRTLWIHVLFCCTYYTIQCITFSHTLNPKTIV